MFYTKRKKLEQWELNPEHCSKHGKLHSQINRYTKPAFIWVVRHALYPPTGCHSPSSFLLRNVRRGESCAIFPSPLLPTPPSPLHHFPLPVSLSNTLSPPPFNTQCSKINLCSILNTLWFPWLVISKYLRLNLCHWIPLGYDFDTVQSFTGPQYTQIKTGLRQMN